MNDEIAVRPVPANHQRDEECTCELPGGAHCSTRYIPVRGIMLLDHVPDSIVWCRVVWTPQLIADSGWFGIPRLSITVQPIIDGQFNLSRFVADQRDPLVIRERLIVSEGHPETGGITDTPATPTIPGPRVPLRLVPGLSDGARKQIDAQLDAKYGPIKPAGPGEETVVMHTSRVPVGVQCIPLSGAADTPGYRDQHVDTAAVDFRSERESE